MRTAVDKIGRGKERQVNARFSAMVYGSSSGYTGTSASNSGPVYAIQPAERCHVTRDFYGFQGRYTSVCGP